MALVERQSRFLFDIMNKLATEWDPFIFGLYEYLEVPRASIVSVHWPRAGRDVGGHRSPRVEQYGREDDRRGIPWNEKGIGHGLIEGLP